MFSLTDIVHRYDNDTSIHLPILEGQQGEHWLILGLSGSGKSTLLHILAGVLRPTKGSVCVADQELSLLKDAALDRFRGRNIGIVFQQMHLVSTLTVSQNLLLAQYMAGLPQDRQRVEEVLASLALSEKMNAFPAALSYGQQQRVAIARAVINKPRLILADEPTSALDDVHSAQVLNLLIKQATTYGATLVIATHDKRVKDHFPNRLNLDALNNLQSK